MKRRRNGLMVVALLGLLFCGCAGRKADTVLVVHDNGTAILGRVEFVKDGRRMRANVWLPGTIVIYRVDATTGSGEKTAAGSVYRVNSHYRIDRIGGFDPLKSDEDLARQYGTEPESGKPSKESKP